MPARILARCRHIATLPLAGRLRDDFVLGLRTAPFERRLVIVYRLIEAAGVDSVFYGGRDYAALYRGRHGDDG